MGRASAASTGPPPAAAARPSTQPGSAPEATDTPAGPTDTAPATTDQTGTPATPSTPTGTQTGAARTTPAAPSTPRAGTPPAAGTAPAPARGDEAGDQEGDQEAPRGTGDAGGAAAPAAPATAAPQLSSQWKIQPLPGDPPLTLFRDKRIVLLPAGTEVDRYGEDNGNVTYAARTEYRHRSLPAEWSDFPYHAYRVQRPLEALTGLAVPWFEQPGGGTAFVLPRSIADLVADGSVAEIDDAKAPS